MRGRRLLLARVAWIFVALTLLGLDVAGLPHAYAQLDTVCEAGACAGPGSDMLSAGDVRELRELGISLDFYAGLTVGLSARWFSPRLRR